MGDPATNTQVKRCFQVLSVLVHLLLQSTMDAEVKPGKKPHAQASDDSLAEKHQKMKSMLQKNYQMLQAKTKENEELKKEKESLYESLERRVSQAVAEEREKIASEIELAKTEYTDAIVSQFSSDVGSPN